MLAAIGIGVLLYEIGQAAIVGAGMLLTVLAVEEMLR